MHDIIYNSTNTKSDNSLSYVVVGVVVVVIIGYPAWCGGMIIIYNATTTESDNRLSCNV